MVVSGFIDDNWILCLSHTFNLFDILQAIFYNYLDSTWESEGPQRLNDLTKNIYRSVSGGNQLKQTLEIILLLFYTKLPARLFDLIKWDNVFT